MEKIIDKFLRYVSFDTTSDDKSESIPTTKGQIVLAKQLVKEIESLGYKATLNKGGVVMAKVKGNVEGDYPTIGFIAHIDTSKDACGYNIKPRIIKDYDMQDIILNKEKNIVLSAKEFPLLKTNLHEDLVVTDGTTLLGADDKAGVAAIMSLLETLANDPSIKHGNIAIAFTPDEEVGMGTISFDVKEFGCDFAYTVDGGPVYDVEYENFNAAKAELVIQGRSIHPGSGKDKMINAILLAMDFNNLLPVKARPVNTEGYEGFYHLMDITGDVEEAKMTYIIRDHDIEKFSKLKEFMVECANKINSQYNYDPITLTITDTYKNMVELIKDKMYIVDIAKDAISKLGYKPHTTPIRGGTDGATLTYQGLPCPNLGAGGYNFHGRYEYLSLTQLEQSVNLLLNIIDNVITNK